MNKEVSFPIAKLLKEKGLKLESAALYDGSGELFYYKHSNNEMQRFRYEAPTIAEVVMWLYEKYGIWIISVPEGLSTTWAFSLFNIDPEKGRIIFNSPSFDSPTEAYEAGIEHILNNLI